MKRLTVAICLFLTGAQFYNNYAQFTEPSITFDKTSYNFATIPELGGIQNHVFSFKNNGSQPLVINEVNTTCGCTVPEWSREPVLPGGTGTIKVSFDPLGRPGAFRKGITVKSNAREASVVLYVVGMVSPKPKTVADDYPVKAGNLRLVTSHISLQTVFSTQVKVDTLRIFNDSDSVLQVTFADVPSHLSLTTRPPELEPRKSGLIYVAFDGSKVNDWGYVMSRVMLILNGNPAPGSMLAISASIQEDFGKWTTAQKQAAPRASVDEESFNFGTIIPGQPVAHDFVLKNEGKDPLIIRKISTTCGCTALKPDTYEIKGGESTLLKCTFDSRGKIGKQFQTITLILNDPLKPSLVLRFLGDVETKSK